MPLKTSEVLTLTNADTDYSPATNETGGRYVWVQPDTANTDVVLVALKGNTYALKLVVGGPAIPLAVSNPSGLKFRCVGTAGQKVLLQNVVE